MFTSEIVFPIAMVSTFLAYVATFIGISSSELAGSRIAIPLPAWAFATSTLILLFGVGSAEVALGLAEPTGAAMGMGLMLIPSLLCVGLPFLIMVGLTLIRGSNHEKLWLLSWTGCFVLSLLPPLLFPQKAAAAPIAICIGAIAGALLAVAWLVAAFKRIQ